jgi:hypothetical protein
MVSQERRQKPRAPLETEVQVRIDSELAAAHIQDISIIGMSLICGYRCQLGSRVQLLFDLPNAPDGVTTEAELVRCHKAGADCIWGLRFVRIHPKMSAAIERFVRDHLVELARGRYASKKPPAKQKKPVPRAATKEANPPQDPQNEDPKKDAYKVRVQGLNDLFKKAIRFIDS